jgi:hypothetical protein
MMRHRSVRPRGQDKDYSGLFLGTILLGIIAIVLMLMMAQSSGGRIERGPFGAVPASSSPLHSVRAGLP